MDAMTGVVDGPRARDAFLLRSSMSPPWSVRIADEAPIAVMAVVDGHAWLVHADIEAPGVRLEPGDVAVVRGPHPYLLADEPNRPVQAIILPGQRCVGPDGVSPSPLGDPQGRDWGGGGPAATELLSGTYATVSEVGHHVLRSLPTVAVLRRAEWDCPVVPLLRTEIGKDRPGQYAVLDRLLDVLLITALRAWFARPDTRAPGWYRAEGDPIVGPVLRRIFDAPERPWTLHSLAADVNVSRATLARRFTELVGEPPMSFLTGWRVALAADLLHGDDATLDTIARRVGYGGGYALSAAFKRVRGVSPREYRATVRSG